MRPDRATRHPSREVLEGYAIVTMADFRNRTIPSGKRTFPDRISCLLWILPAMLSVW